MMGPRSLVIASSSNSPPQSRQVGFGAAYRFQTHHYQDQASCRTAKALRNKELCVLAWGLREQSPAQVDILRDLRCSDAHEKTEVSFDLGF